MATTEKTTSLLSRANQEMQQIISGWQTFQGQLTQAADTVSSFGSLFEKSVAIIGTDPDNHAVAGEPGEPGEPADQADTTGETVGKIANLAEKTYNSFRKSDLINGKIRILLNQVSQATTKIVEQITSLTGSIEEAFNRNTRITQVGVIVKYPPREETTGTTINNIISVNNQTTSTAHFSNQISGEINNSRSDTAGTPSGGTETTYEKVVTTTQKVQKETGQVTEQFEKTSTSLSKIQTSYSELVESISKISATTVTWSKTIEKVIETYTSLTTSIQQVTEVSVTLSESTQTISQQAASINSHIQQAIEVSGTLATSLQQVQEITATIESNLHGVAGACADIFTHLENINGLSQTTINIVNEWQQLIDISLNLQAGINHVIQTTNTFQQSLTQVNIIAGNLQIGINNVTASSAQLEATLDQVNTAMGSINSMAANVNTAMDTLTETSGKVRESLAGIDSVCSEIRGGVDSIRQVAGMAQDSFELMNSTLQKLSQRIDTMQTVTGTAGQQISQMGEAIKKTSEKSSGLGATFSKMKEKVVASITEMMNPMKLLNTAISKAGEFLKGSGAVWKAQVEVQGNLSKTMSGSMNADEAEVSNILQLTAAQEKLGIVSRNVQTAGATELAGHLNKSETLRQLLPSMNNLIAREHGFNATQENAAAMAGLMTQALSGQTDGLARCGIEFTNLQKQILATGTESQRAATLAEAMETSIGGVNQALAATPEGQFRNQANSLEALQGRIGSLYEQVMVALMPLFDKLQEGLAGLITVFEKHQEKISKGITTIAGICGQAFGIVIAVVDSVINIFSSWFEGLEEGNGWVIALTGAIGIMAGLIAAANIQAGIMAVTTWAVTTATTAWTTASSIATAATTAWTTAQAFLNTIMTLNPIGAVIAAVAAFIGLIAYLCSRLEGWGTLWDALVGFMKHSFLAYVSAIKLQFTALVDGIMIGLNYIKKGWYQFREACGIGDSSENQAALREINADIEARQQAIVNGAKEIMEHAKAAKDSLSGINITWKKEENEESEETQETRESAQETLTKSTEVVETITTTSGKVTTRPLPTGGQPATPGIGSGSNIAAINQQYNGGSVAESTVSSINNTGSQSRSVVINLGSMVENIIFNGEFDTNREEVEKDLEQSLLNVLQMAYTAQ